MKILAVCGNGMGTSTIIKISLKKMCKDLGIDAQIESCSAGESGSYLGSTDILVCTPNWEKLMTIPQKGKVVSLINLMNKAELKAGLVNALEL